MIPPSKFSKRISASSPVRGLILVLLAGLPACDNPACLYAPNGCRDAGDGGGGVGSLAASIPDDGNWILPTDPVLDDVFPMGNDAHPGTPVALFFSESLNPDTLVGALELVDSSLGNPVPTVQPPPLVGDGCVVLLAPAIPLTEGSSYTVRLTQGAAIADVTGQALQPGASTTLGQFTVSTNPDPVPSVLVTWPLDRANDQSDIGEIVTVFDRPMDPNTFDTNSFDVDVNGVDPANNPSPKPVTIQTGPVTVAINAVWTWISEDANGWRPSLGAGSAVQVNYSQPPFKLLDEDGGELPATILDYDISDASAPKSITKAVLSDPDDAIGRPNLEDVVPVLQVEVWDALSPGDLVELYLFGANTGASKSLRALQRTHTVTDNTFLADVLPGELDLLIGGLGSPGEFASGDLEVAVLVKKAGDRSAVRMVDVDLTLAGVQPLYFDVTAPQLVGLGTSGSNTTSLSTDVRDLVVVGRADEHIRAVAVSTDTGFDNAGFTEVTMGETVGIVAPGGGPTDPGEFLFVASPVPVGALDPRAAPTGFTMTLYDRALNPSSVNYTGTVRQASGQGPGGAVPVSDTIDVFVSDGDGLAPIAGALVMSHQVLGGVTTWVSSVLTDANGHAPVTSGPAGSETLITVDMNGYDLFSLQGVSRDVLGVQLRSVGWGEATSSGNVTSPFPAVDLSAMVNQVGDNRRSDERTRLIPVDPCSPQSGAGIYTCPFGPANTLPNVLGGSTLLSADFTVSQATFNPVVFLRAIGLDFPLRPLGNSATETGRTLYVEHLLLTQDVEQHPIGIGSIGLLDDQLLDMGPLNSDPLVGIEGLSPGLHGGLTVGVGIPFDVGSGDYDVRGAYAGIADGIDDGSGDQLGELVVDRTVQPDLFLRVEFDGTGGRSGLRPRLSSLAGLGNMLVPPNVPLMVSPAPGANTGGPAFELIACDRLPDAEGLGGMHRFVLTDQTGRRWVLWREDASGGSSVDCGAANQVSVQVPDIAASGGTPLASGPLTCRLSTLAWSSFDVSQGVLWSDIDREQEFFTHSNPVPLILP